MHQNKKVFLFVIVFISAIQIQYSIALDNHENDTKLQFFANADGTFNVASSGETLETLLAKISEATNVDVYVRRAVKNDTVTIHLKNVTLVELLRRVVGDNYAMVFDHERVTALHVLPRGTHVSFAGFSGKVKISDQRARMFFMPPEDTEGAIDNYIRRRHEVLAELSKAHPEKILQAQISFDGYMTDKHLASLVMEQALDPVSLNIGWKENGGGYDLKQGESIEVAMESAKRHHERFIEQIREDADRQVDDSRKRGMTDDEIQPKLTFQKNAHELGSIFQAHGVPFFGIRVSGSAGQLQKMVESRKEVKLVDPLWGGRVEEEIENLYPATKIAIPLVPKNHKFLP